MLFTITTLATLTAATNTPGSGKKKRAKLSKPKRQRVASEAAVGQETSVTRKLRTEIFPTLYAIFQQSRGQPTSLKIKNRTLRSLIRSCLYHKSEDQLQRTQEDAEALLQKYCAHLQAD